ncbi:MAG: hypothetical protein JSR46_00270 [Verrucomicrobia bacterium]|nr:hypothetical protein [Verrucomicrobiota bacterium]
MYFTSPKLLPLNDARTLLVDVVLDFLTKINSDSGLKERGLLNGTFIPNQLCIKICCDNMWGDTYDISYIHEIILDKGRVTYVSFKTVPYFWGKYYTTHELFEYSMMLTGHARPPEVAIAESFIKPRLKAFHGDPSDVFLRENTEILSESTPIAEGPKLAPKELLLEQVNLFTQPEPVVETTKPIEAPPPPPPPPPAIQNQVLPPPKEEVPLVPVPEEKPPEATPPPALPEQTETVPENKVELPSVPLQPLAPNEEPPQPKAEQGQVAPTVPMEKEPEVAPPTEQKAEELPTPPPPPVATPEVEQAAPPEQTEEKRVLVPIEPQTALPTQQAPPKAPSEPSLNPEEGVGEMKNKDVETKNFFEQPQPTNPQPTSPQSTNPEPTNSQPAAPQPAEVPNSLSPAPEPSKPVSQPQANAEELMQQNLASLQRAATGHEEFLVEADEPVTLAKEEVAPQIVKISQKMPHMAVGSAHSLPEPVQNPDQFLAVPTAEEIPAASATASREIAGAERLRKAEEQVRMAFFDGSKETASPPAISELIGASGSDSDSFFTERGF